MELEYRNRNRPGRIWEGVSPGFGTMQMILNQSENGPGTLARAKKER